MALCLVTPTCLPYILYGKTQNGYVILRTPHTTEVIVDGSKIIVGSSDCQPSYTLINKSCGKFMMGFTNPSVSKEDKEIWDKALVVK